MKAKERHLIYELIAIGLAGLFGAMVVPTLLSERDSLAVLCGAILMLGWLGWVAYYLYRANKGGR
jgi:heme A synthase